MESQGDVVVYSTSKGALAREKHKNIYLEQGVMKAALTSGSVLTATVCAFIPSALIWLLFDVTP